MTYSLIELLDVPKLQLLLDSYHEINGVLFTVRDTAGAVIVVSEFQDICSDFHRKCPDSLKLCIESDRHIAAALGEKTSPVVCRNSMGFVDSAAPVVIEGAHVGNVFIGHCLTEPPDETYFVEQARSYGFKEQEYLEALRKVPVLPEETLCAHLNFIVTLLQTQAEQGLLIKQHNEIEEELQKSREMLQASMDQSLKVFAGGVAHDINNILAIIFGYCSLAEMDYETAENHIPGIEMAAGRAAELCRQMLVYAGKSKLVQSQVNMEILVNEMVKMLKSTINLNAVINLDFSREIPFITADASQIRQIVMNLIMNASEAIGEEQGDISVSLTKADLTHGSPEKDHLGKNIPAGVYVCLEVADTGCGMNDEMKRRIFEPFYTTKATGRGLGMAAALGIITAHGGALQLLSAPGQGATFRVYLPIQIGDGAGGELQFRASSAVPWQGNGTILLVEDEAQILLLSKTMLKALGFTVIEALHGKEALELYQKNAAEITLVMTDLSMPVMDGYELFSALKLLNPKVPIIVSSGFGETLVTSRIAREDIAGFASKPYSFAQLREIVKSVVEHMAP